MDSITKNIIVALIKSGHSSDMVTAELDVSAHDIKTALQSAEQNKATNILTEQLASRLPVLLELSLKQLEKIILNNSSDRRLQGIRIVVQAATALAKLKQQ